jgi:phosphotransferase system  glucose/maltose/N-acetylglucosamine-specific IIC component
MSTTKDPFVSIDPTALSNVAGGAARVASTSSGDSDQLMTMLTEISQSIQSLAGNNNGGSDQMMQMMMMMMMMGGGGGGAAVAAAPPPTYVQVSGGGGGGCGKKGW